MTFIETKWPRLVMAAVWFGMLLWFHDNIIIAVTAVIFIVMDLFAAYENHQRELHQKADEERKAIIRKVSEESKRNCDELINQLKSKRDSNGSNDQED